MKHIASNLKEFRILESIDTSGIQPYDVVTTISPDSPNGFSGLGVVERIEGDSVFISPLRIWFDVLKYDNMDWVRKNGVLVKANNIVKITSDNIKEESYNSQKNYEIYIHLLKKYLEKK